MKQTLDLQKLTQRHAAIHTLTGQLQHINARVSIVVKTETVAHITQELVLKGKKRFPTCSFLFIVSIFFLYLMSLDLSLLSLNLGVFPKAILEKI